MGFLEGVFGSKPTLPPWHSLNFGTEAGRAISTNIANVPEAARLANLTEDQILSMMRTAMPGFDQMRTQVGSNINDELEGKIPKDVEDAIANSDAAKAIGGGYGGSGMHSDLVARDLGLTSLHLMDKGLGAAESWLASTERMLSPAAAAFTGMFITPEQQASFDVGERDKQYAHDWLREQIHAMPDPVTAGIMHQFDGTTLLGRNAPQQTGQNIPQLSQASPAKTNDWASGWETADSAASVDGSDYYMGGAGEGSTAAGVSGGMDWAAGSEAYFGALA